MEFLSDMMPKPEPAEISNAEIIDFYCRFGDKKMTAERFDISVKDLNMILKGAKPGKKKDDPFTEVGMKRGDF